MSGEGSCANGKNNKARSVVQILCRKLMLAESQIAKGGFGLRNDYTQTISNFLELTLEHKLLLAFVNIHSLSY